MHKLTKLILSLFFFIALASAGEACCKDKHNHAHSHSQPPPEKPSHSHTHSHEANSREKRQAAENHGHTHSHEHHHGHTHSHEAKDHGHTHDHEYEFDFKFFSMNCCTMKLWYKAMGSTLLISAAPFFILFFIPLDKGEEHKPFLNVLLAFACGGLLGDSFLHLIPHAIPEDDGEHGHTHSHDHGGHGHSHNQGHINCNLWVLAGILTFLLIEKWARMMNIGHSHGGDGHSHGHSHGQVEGKDSGDEAEVEDSAEGEKSEVRKRKNAKKSENSDSGSEAEENADTKKVAKTSAPEPEPEGFIPKMDIAGYLNLAADFSHNFTDGLAIGASYLAGNTVGVVTTLTILVHEVPHEIGDFAILINSGCPRMKAIYLQSSTAIGAMIGTAIGLSLKNIGSDAINAILPFTAGGFIYIACCSIMPELLSSKYNSPKQVFSEFFMMILGIVLMVIIGWFE